MLKLANPKGSTLTTEVRNTYAKATALFAVLVFALLAICQLPFDWIGWKPATCMPNDCFNEAVRFGVVRQPVNAWSSLTFILIGIAIATQANPTVQRERSDALLPNLSPTLTLLYGIAIVVIGLGSWFYHASLTFIGQAFDVQGMYLLITFALIYSASRLISITTATFVMAFCCGNLFLLLVQLSQPGIRRYLFAALVLATLLLEYRRWRSQGHLDNRRYLIAALLLLLIGFSIWLLDMAHLWTSPYSLLQGHAIWHVLSALAAGSLYLHYRNLDGYSHPL